MNPCPKCYSDNVYDAVICRDCKTPLKSSAPTCQYGHQMNETWTECAYCRAEGRLSGPSSVPYRPTTVEGGGAAQAPRPDAGGFPKWEEPLPPPYVPGQRIPTAEMRLSVPQHAPQAAHQSAPPQRRTVYTPAGDMPTSSPSESAGKQAGEKIVAVLVTYTWEPEGQIFPIREGRNRIGRDAAQCDITIAKDDTLSSTHSSITFRKKFVISDLDSKSGTYVNGDPIEEQFFPLANYAEIRTGSTVWTFVMLHPEEHAPTTTEKA